MSLRAGRVGVAPDQVDDHGNIIGGGGDSYTKAQTDTLLAAKANKSILTANNKEFNFAYDATSQKYGYKAGADGEFVPFEGAGGGQGLVLDNLITTGLTFTDCTYVKGGYQIVDGVLYVDLTVKNATTANKNAYIGGFPSTVTERPYGVFYSTPLETIENLDSFIAEATNSFQLNSSRQIFRYMSPTRAERYIMIAKAVVETPSVVETAKKSTRKSTKKSS